MIDIESLTLREIRALQQAVGMPAEQSNPYRIGGLYFIRTVTFYYTGRLVQVTPQELVIEDAAWIADTGRFTQALEKLDFGEVEMFPKGRVIIGRSAVIDASEIVKIPTSQK